MSGGVLVIPAIQESVDLSEELPSVSERYFTHYYYVPKNHLRKFHATNEQDSSCKQIDVGNSTNVDLSQTKKPNLHAENSDEDVSSSCKKIKLDDGVEETICSEQNVANSGDRKIQTESKLVTKLDDNSAMDDSSKLMKMDEGNGERLDETSEHKYDWAAMECFITLEETLVMLHSNKLCVVSLSKYHPVVRGNKTVVKVEYDSKVLGNKCSGKNKRGALVMGSRSTLCRISTECGASYTVACGARGKLVQINERLSSSPDLCRASYGSAGFLAVILPRLDDVPALLEMLPSADQFDDLVKRCVK